MAASSQDRGGLIHDPAEDPDAMLGALGEKRVLDRLEAGAGRGGEDAGESDLERRRRGHADADGQVPGHGALEPVALDAEVAEFGQDGCDVAAESLRRQGQIGQVDADCLTGRIARELDHPGPRRLATHGDGLFERNRQHEAAGVVDVLADQVDPTGSAIGDHSHPRLRSTARRKARWRSARSASGSTGSTRSVDAASCSGASISPASARAAAPTPRAVAS